MTTKMSLFIENYGRELRMGVDLRKNGKMEKVTKFVERMKKVQEETGAALVRVQKETKRQVDRRRKVGNRVILSMKDLVFKERLVKKLVN